MFIEMLSATVVCITVPVYFVTKRASRTTKKYTTIKTTGYVIGVNSIESLVGIGLFYLTA